MAQSKSKSSKQKSKKAAPVTAKKVTKRTVESAELTPAPIFPSEPALASSAMAPAAAPSRDMSRAEFLELVRKEAYRSAARRDFKNGSPFQDWLAAEAAVSGKLAAEGVRLS